MDTLTASALAHKSWANTENRAARTAKARSALEQKFLNEAGGDPQRAEHLRKAYYKRLALKSVQARRANASKAAGGRTAPEPAPLDSPDPLAGVPAEVASWATRSPSPMVPRPSLRTPDDPVALYRHYDALGVLLYIGITSSSVSRGSEHAKASQWVRFAATEGAVWYPNRREAVAAERVAIAAEAPIFNKTYAPERRAQRVVSYLLERGETDALASGDWS